MFISSLKDKLLPKAFRRWLVRRTKWPPVGHVRFGHLRRVDPISREWGFDRGYAIDRYYIEKFLSAHAAAVRGRVLEVADNKYTRMFGAGNVTESDIIHPTNDNPRATVIGDLTEAGHVEDGTFDCILCTQTLHLIYEVEKAVRTLHRILKDGGVLLATLPGISQISRHDMDRWGDNWRFTSLSAQRLFQQIFGDSVEIMTYGNVLAAISFLHGLSAEELTARELDHADPDYELLICVRAKKHDARNTG